MRLAHRTLPIALAAALLAVSAPAAHAQKIKGSATLKARAKIRGDSAKKIARAQVPNGKIRSGELEEEKGKLIYSFDLKAPHKSGVEEVNVDANTGTVVKKEHESAKAEKAEMKKEANAMKKEAKTTKP